jgi:PAS domain S-box-containing protein
MDLMDCPADLPLDFAEISYRAPALIWVSNAQKQGVWFNKAWLEYTGAQLEDELGDGWLRRICPEDMIAIQECVDAFAAKRPFRTEFRLRRADGVYRWMIDTGQPRFGPEGVFRGFVGSLVDIDDRKAAETDLQRLNAQLEEQVRLRTSDLETALRQAKAEAEEKRKLERAYLQSQKIQTLGQLTGGVAHDFNNLLTPILGGLQLVLEMSDEPVVKPLLRSAIASAHRGAELTKRLLSFSRVQSLDIRPVQLRDLFEDMKDLLERSLGPLVAIDLELPDDDVMVQADQTQLELAVLNLAINARDAMPEGGVVQIKTIKSAISDQPDVAPGEYLQILVTDHGVGMSAEVAAQACDPFFTTKQVGAGTGLGLSMVSAVAQQCGGVVRLETSLGKGTTVCLALPVVAGSDSASDDTAIEMATGRAPVTARVLVVDDDPDVREFVAYALKASGHNVITATGGSEALELMEQLAPDLLITDYAMPEMSGADLARAIRKRNPAQRIIYISGFEDAPALAKGAADAPLLRKPFAPHELYETVQKSLATSP